VTFITSGFAVTRSVERALAAVRVEQAAGGEGSYRFHCTGSVPSFESLGSRFLQMPLGEVVHVDLARVAEAERLSAGGLAA
jgi:glutamate racemase